MLLEACKNIIISEVKLKSRARTTTLTQKRGAGSNLLLVQREAKSKFNLKRDGGGVNKATWNVNLHA